MKPIQQLAACSMPDEATRVNERHYGLETLGTYRGCSMSGAYRYEIKPTPRAIYQAYAFKDRALLFIQVVQMLMSKTERRDPLEVKENLERLALRAVMDRIDSSDFEVGEQYDALLMKARERAASERRKRRVAYEGLPRYDRGACIEKERREELGAFYATSY